MVKVDKIFKNVSATCPKSVSYEHDKISKQSYLIFENLETALEHKDAFKDYISASTEACGFKEIQFLDFDNGDASSNYKVPGPYTSLVNIKLDKDHLIIIKNADLAETRKKFLGDDSLYPYQLSFKNAEYHSYCALKQLEDNKTAFFGSSVYPFKRWIGAKIMRFEEDYETKYFKGNIFVNHGKLNPKLDKGSLSIDVLITKEQYQKLVDYIDDLRVKFDNNFVHAKDIHEADSYFFSNKFINYLCAQIKGASPYNFYNNNCHNDVQDIYHILGFKDHFFNFMRADNADLSDMGELYDFWCAHGTYNTLIQNYSTSSKTLAKLCSQTNINKKYDFDKIFELAKTNKKLALEKASFKDSISGNTALHWALLNEDTEISLKLIELGMDLNAINHKGQLPLHLAANLPHDLDNKLELMAKVIAGTTDVNQPDLYAENIALTYAILADDPQTIKLLVQKGANIHYINLEYDNLGIIASENKKHNAAKTLYELDHNLLFFNNLTKQIPFYDSGLIETVNDPELPVLPKNYNELYLIIDDINKLFPLPLHNSSLFEGQEI